MNQWDAIMERLTPREKEIVGLLLEGYAHYAIAEKLGLSQRTVQQRVYLIAKQFPGPGRGAARIRNLYADRRSA